MAPLSGNAIGFVVSAFGVRLVFSVVRLLCERLKPRRRGMDRLVPRFRPRPQLGCSRLTYNSEVLSAACACLVLCAVALYRQGPLRRAFSLFPRPFPRPPVLGSLPAVPLPWRVDPAVPAMTRREFRARIAARHFSTDDYLAFDQVLEGRLDSSHCAARKRRKLLRGNRTGPPWGWSAFRSRAVQLGVDVQDRERLRVPGSKATPVPE